MYMLCLVWQVGEIWNEKIHVGIKTNYKKLND